MLADKFNWNELPGNWFDGVVLVWLLVGMVRGWKRGMSVELLSVFEVLVVVTCCGYLHRPIGAWFQHYAEVPADFAMVFVYLCLLVLLVALFGGIKRLVGGKATGSALFGRAERVLGMLSGAVRYLGVVVIFLAVLNAWDSSAQKVAEARARTPRGKGRTWIQAHFEITRQSYVAGVVQRQLSVLLIEPAADQKPAAPWQFSSPKLHRPGSRTNAPTADK